nr:helix-turn-helix transcriptional regulator [uncultured Bdellovibrio sp.]
MQIDEKTWKLVRRISKNIRRLREERGWTQEDMEDHGFGVRWYQRFESGRHVFTLPTLDKLARAFKVDITELFKEPKDRH